MSSVYLYVYLFWQKTQLRRNGCLYPEQLPCLEIIVCGHLLRSSKDGFHLGIPVWRRVIKNNKWLSSAQTFPLEQPRAWISQPSASCSTPLNHSQSKDKKTPSGLTSSSSHQGLAPAGGCQLDVTSLCHGAHPQLSSHTEGENMAPVKPSWETCILNLWVRTGW